MTVRQQELFNIIETLPDELSTKVIDYIEYLKFTTVIKNAPERVVIKSKEDLRKKLEEGIKDSDNENVFSVDEVFKEIDEILAN